MAPIHSSTDFAHPTQGGAGGNGGTGGTVSLQWLSGTVQTNLFGLHASAGGGIGGDGGTGEKAQDTAGAMAAREAMAGRPTCFSVAARSRSSDFSE